MAQFDGIEQSTGIDPNFFLPPNVVDLRYAQNTEEIDDGSTPETDTLAGASNPVDQDPEVSGSDSNNPESDSHLPIPEDVTFVSQTVRVVQGGGYVVDVILNVGDIVGVENFDVQVAKI